ncbi:C6 finger domain transcription factor nscR [Lachnellula suecica]|uniref:C6 finger domain transcription factor nscR n=1 Tax=Lachnellula suecica TaxID=602035 RepID=A0A8T9CIK8_9HELO|nr:C6 finger domain transcription factor nscR [Lachnellula suecica]
MQRNVPIPGFPEYERKVNLTCLQCQRRKRKCDKGSPCQTCQQAGITCTAISRARLPRGRHAAQRGSGDLRQRVARLEALLSSQNSDVESRQLTPPKDDKRSPDSTWASISEQIVGIRELVDSLAGDDSGDPAIETSETDRVQRFDVLLYSDASCFVQPHVLESPPDKIVFVLLEIYFYRVDPVFKVLHSPTLRAMFNSSTLSPAEELLKFAVLYTAVNSLDEEECLQRLSLDKKALSGRLQLATEVLLSKLRLLTTSDMTVLQAFVIYLVGLRTCIGSRSVLVLLATAIRIGQCMGLDIESPHETPFKTELKRRVWYAMGILDLQATFDHGSHSAIPFGAYSGALPSNINDEDLSPDSVVPPPERYSFSEMTFCSATCDMMHYMRKVMYTPLDFDGRPLMEQTWAQRYAIVEESAQALNEKYIKHCDPKNAFQFLTKVVCEGMIVNLRLLIRRPMHRFYTKEPPPNDCFNLLEITTEILDHTLKKGKNKDFKPWAWFAWNKWYALAVLLAELCEHTEGTLVDRAWIIAEASFSRLKDMKLDTILLRSMGELMRKAQSARNSKNRIPKIDYLSISENVPLNLNFLGAESARLDYQSFQNPHRNGPSQQDNAWEELELLSWNNWESFVQDLGDPISIDSINGFY